MWISRKDLKALQGRVEWLEKNLARPDDVAFTIYDPTYLGTGVYYHPIPSETVSVKTAIERVMHELGMKFEYVKGSPTRVNITSAPDAASHQEEKS